MAAPIFNKDQLRGIRHRTGPAMVIAGPGSGKTTVITNRVRFLVESGTARPEEILVITFTVAAAAEMKSRTFRLCADSAASALPRQNYSQLTFGTFHSVFYRFLRSIPEYAHLRLAEGTECIAILRRIVQRLCPGNKYTSDYYTYLLNRISVIKNTESIYTTGVNPVESQATLVAQTAADILTGYTVAGNDCSTLAVHKMSALAGTTANAAAADLPHRLIGIYQAEMLKNGLIDFDDMLVLFNERLKTDKAFRDALRNRFRFVMIDEFQDINRVQFEAVRLLAAPLNNIFAVGDDDQSIYAFRGSDPSIMLKFKDYYPQAAYIELFTNYRSSKRIIRAASRLISHNQDRYAKQFNAVSDASVALGLRSFRTQVDEAAWVAADIIRLSHKLNTVGILYRTHRTGLAVKRAISEITASSRYELPYISLMSFHAAKGLEFDAVYIISANEGITPSKTASIQELEEERRLFYVAMTRAKQYLHISDTDYIYNRAQTRSRFVREALGLKAVLPAILKALRM